MITKQTERLMTLLNREQSPLVLQEINEILDDPKDIDLSEVNGESALSIVTNKNNEALMHKMLGIINAKKLIEKNSHQIEGFSIETNCLFEAIVAHASNNTLEALLKMGADINAQDTDGNTRLMLAVQSNKNGINNELIALLIANGADISVKNKDGKTARTIKEPIDPGYALACLVLLNVNVLYGVIAKESLDTIAPDANIKHNEQDTRDHVNNILTTLYTEVAIKLLGIDLSHIEKEFMSAQNSLHNMHDIELRDVPSGKKKDVLARHAEEDKELNNTIMYSGTIIEINEATGGNRTVGEIQDEFKKHYVDAVVSSVKRDISAFAKSKNVSLEVLAGDPELQQKMLTSFAKKNTKNPPQYAELIHFCITTLGKTELKPSSDLIKEIEATEKDIASRRKENPAAGSDAFKDVRRAQTTKYTPQGDPYVGK